jgi:hypothetical protein
LKKKGPKYNLDPRIFPPDPRELDAVSQIVYVIRCLERGLSKQDIVSLYMDDTSAATIIIDLIMKTGLIARDDKGKWRRTDKAKRLIVGSRSKDL